MIWKTVVEWIQVNKKDSHIKTISIVNDKEESLKLFMQEYENTINPKKPEVKPIEEKKGVKRGFEQTETKKEDAMAISLTQPEDNMIMSSQTVENSHESPKQVGTVKQNDSQPLFPPKKNKKVKKTYLGDSQPIFGKMEHSQMDQSQN